MNGVRPTIDVVLDGFFGERARGGPAGMKQRRLRSLELRLREYLEAEGDGILVTDDGELLAVERQFDAVGAFCRTMHADDLVFALPGFLERCVPEGLVDLRLQLSTIEALMAWLIRTGLLDSTGLECIMLDVGSTLRRGRAELRERRAALGSDIRAGVDSGLG
jgi:hypothetical protein